MGENYPGSYGHDQPGHEVYSGWDWIEDVRAAGEDRVNNPGRMRDVARELAKARGPLTGDAFSEGYTTGTISSIRETIDPSGSAGSALSERGAAAVVGKWDAAKDFGTIISSAGTQFGTAYQWFIDTYDDAIRAIERNADIHDTTEHANQGN
ncbi:hypothetical protein FH608_004085 [Nonomuraea phyllanthi]|uniref:Uncharacterized protein n=1 Tax=Nonomuraea phyllanthi TaxID=2219224 RepID=A0A5C4WY35_9ACTN|nr:hypothetical protein [Nonomuraea phyllanthi]KAB8197716.1 hypothetical protein FH608_004085 [Nonomuraea phyllanthi]QFY06307.1 hypothetical protein GBF35_06110 [Nonomuraea phyllanthi]